MNNSGRGQYRIQTEFTKLELSGLKKMELDNSQTLRRKFHISLSCFQDSQAKCFHCELFYSQ